MNKIPQMEHRVDLIWLDGSNQEPPWPLGKVSSARPTPEAIHDRTQEQLDTSDAQYFMFWDSELGIPDWRRVQVALGKPGDLWHAGLRLGMGGLPQIMDFVAPTWMLNRDPDAAVEATSWRLSLRACLMRTEILRRMGGVRREFRTLEGASCEMGHRYVMHGVLTRHLPSLIPERVPPIQPLLPFEDQLRFMYYRFGRSWARWALLRASWTGLVSVKEAR